MSSPIATTLSSPPYDRLKAVKEFDETKAGVKGLNDSNIKTIPSFFIHPPKILYDIAPQSGPEPEIPTIDLSAIHDSRASVVNQIRSAASTVGFFQVINHGVSEDLLRSVVGALKALHEQPAEVRAQVYRREAAIGVSYISNVDLFTSKAANWRDTLQDHRESPMIEFILVLVSYFVGPNCHIAYKQSLSNFNHFYSNSNHK
ncbi:1-aminocyclopropane-1-carboxylate oxidase homolog 1-like [Vicia villosa]|uniref:1-aminocyclopropane-1-carboxylate oxidase homolog 1-like n=1 Tax=Vicia villosa TaxID=3911 RepID=UPI00273C5E0E|nr:1-aminocyclopropane-1-carboxylate oxidase homolog 1-like [Vicia villosa]